MGICTGSSTGGKAMFLTFTEADGTFTKDDTFPNIVFWKDELTGANVKAYKITKIKFVEPNYLVVNLENTGAEYVLVTTFDEVDKYFELSKTARGLDIPVVEPWLDETSQ